MRGRVFFLIFLIASLTACGAEIPYFIALPNFTSSGNAGGLLTALSGNVSVASSKFGSSFSCALSNAGSLSCWGANTNGQLGDGTQISRNTAFPVDGLSSGVTQFSLGGGFTTANVNGYTVSWGSNLYYSLGDSTTTNRLDPVSVVGLTGTSLGISAGKYFACSLQSGTTYCWGLNSSGQLGTSNTAIGNLPAAAYNSTGTAYTFTKVTTGTGHTCAVNASGAVYCWGENTLYQLGDGTGLHQYSPTLNTVLTSGVTDISAGYNHTCAIKAGKVYCWGANNFGQLGLGTTTDGALCPATVTSPQTPCSSTNSSTSTNPIQPLLITGISSAVNIYAGAYHNCALTSGGTLYCWGRNDYGQLGTGAISAYSSVPVTVSILASTPTSVAPGILHTCVAAADTSIQCWGDNGFGELGDGTNNSSLTPVTVKQ